MFNKILSVLGIDSIMSGDMIKKGVEKLDPRLKGFFKRANEYGYPLGAAIGFLKSEFGGKKENQVDPSLRPDQAANLEIKRQNERSSNFLGKAANVAVGAGLGGALGAGLSAVGQKIGSQPQQQQQEQPMQQEAEMSPQQQVIKKYNAMKKKNSLVGKLEEDFQREYGSPLRDVQAPSNSSDDELIAAMQQILKM